MRVPSSNAPTCPLCHRPNTCGAATGNCWCFSVTVPPALLAQLPADQRDTACVCRDCIDAFNRTAKPERPAPAP